MICNECETVAHCTKHGCVPKQPAPVQPLTWLKTIETPGGFGKFVEAKPNEKGAKPVYLTPPTAQRQWVGLTQEERLHFLNEILDYGTGFVAPLDSVIWSIEAKLKEKNSD